jgi:type I restriction enzyme, S subunit
MKKGWQTKTLGEACEMYQPKTISGKDMVEDGAYPVYGANGVIGRYDQFNHEEPQLLITCRGATCGSVNISAPRSWVTGNAMVVRPKNESLEMRYLEYLFRGGIDISQAITGAAQPQITRTNLEPLEISFPESLAEQQRIVGLLDEAFEGLATAKANAEKNLQNARALFESHLQSVLRNKKWKWKTLGDLCDDVEYGSSAKSKAEGGVPVLRMGNIQDGRLDWENLVYTDDKAEIKKYLLNYNDVLFNRTNSPELVGKTAIYKSEMPAIFAGYLIRIHRKEDLLDGDFLTYFLNSQIAFDHGKTVVISSVNQANINGTKLKSYPIPAPSLAEQKAIVAKLDELSEETQRLARLYEQKLAALEALKKSLLHQAFTGEL